MSRNSWDKDQILITLKRLHREGEDLSYSKLARKMQPLVSAAAYHFGSYRSAIEKAGIDYAEVVRRPRWTKPYIIKLIKEARKRNEDLHWSAVTRRGDELSRAAFASLQQRLFGSWDRALAGAGLDADEISQYRKWTRDTIATELKNRARESLPLNSGSVQKDEPGLHAAAVRHFGTFDDALRAAKVNPVKVRRRQRWSREEVIRQLAALGKKGVNLDGDIRRGYPALYGAAMRLFGGLAAARAEMV